MILKREFINKVNQLGKSRKTFIFIIDFLGSNPMVLTEKEADKIGLKFNFKEGETNVFGKDNSFSFEKSPMSYEKYQRAFDKVMTHIKRGDTFLVNLTFPTPIKSNLKLEEIYNYSKAKYKLLWPEKFVVFSPEPFIKIENDKIFSYPMKGTIDAATPYAEKILMDDLKEQAEHNTIVDLIRNDLSIVAKKVSVEKFRYIEEVKTHEKRLLQTSSLISGYLEKNWQSNIGDILNKLLPAGSISGAPKKKL